MTAGVAPNRLRMSNWGRMALGGSEGRGITTFKPQSREPQCPLDKAVRAGSRPTAERLTMRDIQASLAEGSSVGCVSAHSVCSCARCSDGVVIVDPEWTLEAKRLRRESAERVRVRGSR